MLFFGGAAPGRVHPDLGDALWKTFRRLLDRGITPVYQWTGHSAPLIHEEASWRAAGVVVFASPSPMANPMLMRPDPIRPQPLDLVQAFVPECVVYLSADALGTDLRAASGDASRATVVFAAHHPIHEIEGRVDAHCGPGELPDLIDDFVAHRAPQAPVQVAHIEPVETTPGLTSVIIPVFNRWELNRLVGFCLMARRRTIERVGAFDEGFGMGNFEDDELGRRVMAAGRTKASPTTPSSCIMEAPHSRRWQSTIRRHSTERPAISEIGRTPAPPRRPHSFSATATPSELPPRPPLR